MKKNKPSAITREMAMEAKKEIQALYDENYLQASSKFAEVLDYIQETNRGVPEVEAIALAVWYEAAKLGYDHKTCLGYTGAFLYGYCVRGEMDKLNRKLTGAV